jgi:hypothetical protein
MRVAAPPRFDEHDGLCLRPQLGEDVELSIESFGAGAVAAIREFAWRLWT